MGLAGALMTAFAYSDSARRPAAIVVVDFGSQYTHLIARRIRELRVYSEIVPASAGADALAGLDARGVILSGGPASVYDAGAPAIPDWVMEGGRPVLGICYGMQALVQRLGGVVAPGARREYGHAELRIRDDGGGAAVSGSDGDGRLPGGDGGGVSGSAGTGRLAGGDGGGVSGPAGVGRLPDGDAGTGAGSAGRGWLADGNAAAVPDSAGVGQLTGGDGGAAVSGSADSGRLPGSDAGAAVPDSDNMGRLAYGNADAVVSDFVGTGRLASGGDLASGGWGLLGGLAGAIPVWMSHGDRVERLPPGMRTIAGTDNTPCAAVSDGRLWHGLQFHPEVRHTPDGMTILRNFVYDICGCAPEWTPGNFVADAIARIRQQVGSDRVICGLSGGVDSAVAALLLHRAIGANLECIFVNNGLLRHNEAEQVQDTFRKNLGLNLHYVDAADRFLNRLAGVTDPEAKRKAIGEEFIRVFEDAAAELRGVRWLAQGTLYPDVIESETPENRASARIKSHHNVGGLPERMDLGLVEPLRYLFKDEARAIGRELGLPGDIVYRQPFPGPGLAIRIIGEVTPERVALLRNCDRIVLEEIAAAGLYRDIWQSFAVLTDNRTVGVMGDYRTYGYACVIRAVNSEDAMTADWVRLPYETLAGISNRIVNEVAGVNRVVYDITSKPPGTIEWE